MPTYEYKCDSCGIKFEARQSINDDPITQCTRCNGKVRRLISGGSGFIMKGSYGSVSKSDVGGCSLKQTGTTCCGRSENCGKSSCGAEA